MAGDSSILCLNCLVGFSRYIICERECARAQSSNEKSTDLVNCEIVGRNKNDNVRSYECVACVTYARMTLVSSAPPRRKFRFWKRRYTILDNDGGRLMHPFFYGLKDTCIQPSRTHTTRPLTCLRFLTLISRQKFAQMKAQASIQMLVISIKR